MRDLASLMRWTRLIARVRPDIVVASTPKASLLALMAAWALRTPHRIYHCRGLWFEGYSGPMRKFGQVAELLISMLATEILSDSESLGRVLLGVGVRRRPVVLGSGSCSGVDTRHFRPPTNSERRMAKQSLGVPLNAVTIAYVGRINRHKGLAELAAAYGQLCAAKLQGEVHLLLAGPLEDARLLAEILEHLPDDRVTAIPYTVETRQILWASDIFVYPSRREGFPIAPLEAAACGLPVAATTVTGCRDAVRHRETGLLCERDDVEALATALEALTLDADLRSRLGANGRSWVNRCFNQEDVVQRHVNWYLSRLQSS